MPLDFFCSPFLKYIICPFDENLHPLPSETSAASLVARHLNIGNHSVSDMKIRNDFSGIVLLHTYLYSLCIYVAMYATYYPGICLHTCK